MDEEEIVFKNESFRNERMISALKKTLEFNEKYVEVLKKQQAELEYRIKLIKKNNGIK